MKSTNNYSLPTYDETDSPNLITGYNGSMVTIDSALKSVSDRVGVLENKPTSVPTEIQAFFTALGLTADNATALGTTLSHLLNGTGDATLSVSDLASAKVTAEGLPFIPTSK